MIFVDSIALQIWYWEDGGAKHEGLINMEE
jgi:hypothetical protein